MARYEIPDELQYTANDEWARVEGDLATVGITDYAQSQLGDVVFIELPEVGASVEAGEGFGTIESVKAVSDLYAPFSGTVASVNENLAEQPELVNSSCYGEGWMITIEVSGGGGELMDADAYRKHVEDRED